MFDTVGYNGAEMRVKNSGITSELQVAGRYIPRIRG